MCQEIFGFFVCFGFGFALCGDFVCLFFSFTDLASRAVAAERRPLCDALPWLATVAFDSLAIGGGPIVRRPGHRTLRTARICGAGRVTSGAASRIRCRRPSRMSQSHPRTARSICAATSSFVSHSICGSCVIWEVWS